MFEVKYMVEMAMEMETKSSKIDEVASQAMPKHMSF